MSDCGASSRYLAFRRWSSERPGSSCPAPRSCVDRWLGWSAGQSRRRVAPEGLSGGRLRMGRSTDKETGLSEQRKYRSWTAQQKIEIVLAGLRGDRSVKEVCREHEISDTLFYSWRDKLLEGGREALAGKEERSGERELRRKIRELERALGRKTYELEIAGEALPVSRAGRTRLRRRGRGARDADQPAGALPDAEAEKGAAAAAIGRPGRGRDRRGSAGEPDRRLPDGDRVRAPQARRRGQPQAGAAGAAGAEADPAPPPARAQEAARLLPSRAAAAAVAARHDLGLGRRPRLDVPDGDHRLLHPRDRRLAARAALPRRRSDRGRRTRGRAASHRAWRADARLRQRLRLHRPPLQGAPGRARDQASPRRLPRPRVTGLHRKLVRETQRTGGVAERVRDPRRRTPRDRRLRRPLPPPPAQRARLPDATRGAADLGRSTKHRGLT